MSRLVDFSEQTLVSVAVHLQVAASCLRFPGRTLFTSRAYPSLKTP